MRGIAENRVQNQLTLPHGSAARQLTVEILALWPGSGGTAPPWRRPRATITLKPS